MIDPPDPELEIFSAARKLPKEERPNYLDKACVGDAALRQRVEELLQASNEAGDFLECPPAAPTEETARIPMLPAEKPGDRIGRYKLLQQIGKALQPRGVFGMTKTKPVLSYSKNFSRFGRKSSSNVQALRSCRTSCQ